MHSTVKLNHCFRSYTRKTLKIVQTAHGFQSALFLFKGCCLTNILLWYTIYTSLKLVFIWNMLVFKWNMYNHAIYIKKKHLKKQYWPKKKCPPWILLIILYFQSIRDQYLATKHSKSWLQTVIWAKSWANLFVPYANNKGADQPAHPRSLISTFVVHCLDSIIHLLAIAEIPRL